MRRLDLAGALALALLAAAPARALRTETLAGAPASPATVGARPLLVTSGQALLQLSSGTAPASLDGALAALGVRRLSDLGGGVIVVGWDGPVSVSQRLAALKTVPGALRAEPSRVYSVRRVPNDPLVASQYALSKTDAFRAWEYETGASSRVTVAVVDTGVDGSHPDLSAKFVNTVSGGFDPNSGAPFANNPPTPACQHATEVAGDAAASSDNGLAVAGMSWGAQLVSYKVFLDSDCKADCSDNAPSACVTNDAGIIAAVNKAASVQNTAAYGRMVVNLSLGGAGACPALVQNAITSAYTAGVVVVAAAGNDGLAVNSPGNCAHVIPVGATDSSDAIAWFSSNGPELAAHGLAAPGVSVLTTAPGGGTASPSGTSFSSPLVAGAAALLLAAKPTLTVDQVEANLRAGAESLGQPANSQGAGRMNIYRSIYLTLNSGALPPVGEVNAAPKAFAYPNPVSLSKAGGVQLSVPPAIDGAVLGVNIYTLDGKFVRAVTTKIWDGKNAAGNKVATGTYMFVVKTSKGESSGRVTVIR